MLAGEVPAAFEQVKVNVKLPEVIGISTVVPAGSSVPLQLPRAMVFAFPDGLQLVAVGDDQVIVVEVLPGMEVAPSVSVGAAGFTNAAVTISVAELAADVPPALLQVNVNVSVPTVVGVIVLLPLAANVPLQLPDAAQLAALTDDQVSVVDPWTATEFAASDNLGAAGAADAESTAKFTVLAADVPEAFAQVRV